jgi:hypothetical protein
LKGGIYYYRVQAFNDTTTSAFSNVDSVLIGAGDNLSVIDYSGGFASHSDITANGSTTFAVSGGTTVARLTDGGANETATFFYTHRVGIQSFDTTFAFQIHDGTPAPGDGMTFIIQGNTPTAISGPSGGGLGYGPDHVGGSGGIPNSIAIKFDIFNNQGEGTNSTGLFVNGDAPTIPTSSSDTLVKLDPSVINLSDGDPFRVHLTYDGTTLTETITDTITNKTFTTKYTVNIAADVGGNVGYVGFGAATGGNTANQDILAWIYTDPPLKGVHKASTPPIRHASGDVQLGGGSTPGSTALVIPLQLASTDATDELLSSYPKTRQSLKTASKTPSLLF